MKIAIVHGYFLNGTGSNLYVQNLCRKFCEMGHDVILVCQERELEKYDFIEEGYLFNSMNSQKDCFYRKDTIFKGKCRCIVPNLGKILPVYVKDKYKGFDAIELTKLPEEDIDFYIDANTKAIRTAFEEEKPDIAISNHIILQPVYVKRAIEHFENIKHFIVIHGSAFNFSAKKRELLIEYSIEALNQAHAVVFLTDYSKDEFEEFFKDRIDFDLKKIMIPAGVDISNFIPLKQGVKKSDNIAGLINKLRENGVQKEDDADTLLLEEFKTRTTEEISVWKERLIARGESKKMDYDIKEKLSGIDWDKDKIILFYGKYLWTKGIHTLILALPFILDRNPDVKLVLVGYGSSRGYLELLADKLDHGDREGIIHLLGNPEEFQGCIEENTKKYSKYILDIMHDKKLSKKYLKVAKGRILKNIIFTGFMDHSNLKEIIPCADIVVTPSIFPEAFGLVGVEALSSGVLPLQTYHSGFSCVVDTYADIFKLNPGLSHLERLYLDENLVLNLSKQVNAILEFYDIYNGPLVDEIRVKARQIAEKNYSWDSVALKFLE